MFDAYFNDIKNKMIMKKIQEDKQEKMYLQADKKPADAPKPADDKKPLRAASATPKAQSMKAPILEPKDKLKKTDLDKIE